jgi:hypothetical protein
MRIEYILIRFLHFMSYKSFEQKTMFLFSKEKASPQKWRKNILKWIFLFLLIWSFGADYAGLFAILCELCFDVVIFSLLCVKASDFINNNVVNFS